MKIIQHEKEEVTDINRELVRTLETLHKKIFFNKVRYLPETEEERKLVGEAASFGNDFTKNEYYSIVTDNKEELVPQVYSLQFKEEIKELWKSLNTLLIHSKKCLICGEEQGFYIYLRVKRCSKEQCRKIHDLLHYHFYKLINRIEKLERRFTCEKCKKEYCPTRKDSKFCSINCRVSQFRKIKKEVLNETKEM